MNGIFEPTNFKSIISSLKDRFFTVEEFPAVQRELLPSDILKKASELQTVEVRYFAARLKGKELEALILDLRDAADPKEIRLAAEILMYRVSKRILKLLTILYQYNPDSAGLNHILKDLAREREEKKDTSVEAAFIRRFGAAEDKISAVASAIDEYEMDIDKCFQALSIYRKSPFAEEAAMSYLEAASREALMTNRRWIVSTIEHQDSSHLYPLIVNYLTSFSLIELHDGINLAIMHRIGQPYKDPDWEPYKTELRDKFAQWCFLHQLKLHAMGFPKKFSVLRKYFDQVRNSYMIKEENLLVIDFGDIVLADVAGNPYSFFYEKAAFEKEMADWKEDPQMYPPSFLRLDRKNLTARDFIIEEIEEPCIKLSYEGIDVLYIQEMLDIKIGLEPDMRRKQLAKIKKRGASAL